MDRQIDIIQATLSALEKQSDNRINPLPDLGEDAKPVDYLHHGVGMPHSAKERRGSGKKVLSSQQQSNQAPPPPHVDSTHPNPKPWKPSSHYPRTKTPPAPHNPEFKKKPVGDPFIDRFIEEIADLVGQTGVDAAINSSLDRPLSSAELNAHPESDDQIRRMAKTLGEGNPLAAGTENAETRKNQVIGQLYDIFSKVQGNQNNSKPLPPTHQYLRASLPRSHHPPPLKPSSSEPRPKFTTNVKYTPSNQYTPKRLTSTRDSLPAPSSLHTTPNFSGVAGNTRNSVPYDSLNKSMRASITGDSMEGTHMGNLYHIMNIAFLLIEEEREQYVSVIERTRDQGVRGRVLSSLVMIGFWKRFRSKLCKWAVEVWRRVTKEHLEWLRANQMKVLKGEEYERRLQAATNAINRMRNGLLLRVFKGWCLFLTMETRNRALLEKFSKKLLLRSLYKSLEAWKQNTTTRKWLRGIVNRCIGGKSVSLKSSAFRAWKHNTIDLGTVDDLQKYSSELEDKLSDYERRFMALESKLEMYKRNTDAEAVQHKNNTLRKTMYRMLNSALGSAFHEWHSNAKAWREQAKIIEKASRRWKMQGVMRCLNKWRESILQRVWLRKFVKRMLGGKDHALLAHAFHHYVKLVAHLKEANLNLEMQTIIERCEFLEQKLLQDKLAANEKALRRVKNSIKLMRESTLKNVFNMWKNELEEKKIMVAKGKRFFSKLLRGLEVRTLKTWVEYTNERRRVRTLVRRVFNRVVNRSLILGFQCWQSWIQDEKKNETIIRRIGMKMLNACLARCLTALATYAKEKKQERVLLKRAGMKLMMRCFANCFGMWKENITQQIRERNLLEKFGRRMRNKLVFQVFQMWAENAAKQREGKRSAYRVLCRISNSKLSAGWKQWNAFIARQKHVHMWAYKAMCRIINSRYSSAWGKWAAFVNDHRQKANQMSVLSMAQARERNKQRREGARWQKDKNETEEQRKERIVKVAMGRIVLRSISKTYESWVAYLERRRRAKYLCGRVMGRLVGGKMAAGFYSWKAHVERMLWEENTLKKFLVRMKNAKAFKILKAWQSWIGEEKRYRVVVARFLKKMKNRELLGFFNKWTEFKSTRRWLRGMINKACGGKETKAKMAGFGKWKTVVRDMRVLESFAGNAEEIERLKQAMADANRVDENNGAELSEAENARLRVAATLTRVLGNKADRSNVEVIRRRSIQWAFVTWRNWNRVFASRQEKQAFGPDLTNGDVERIDTYMVMFAHAFNNVNQISSLFAVASVSVAHMVRGARGNLFLVDRKRHELFTVSGSSVQRCAIGLGIVGHVARTGESVLTELIMDSRFDENIDRHCMETDSFTQTETHIIAGNPGRERSFSHTQYGLLGSKSPLLLAIAVRNCEGVVIGVLTATQMPEGGESAALSFGNEDCLVMHLMAQFTAGNIEKIAAKKVLSAASNNIVACENTLKTAIGVNNSRVASAFLLKTVECDFEGSPLTVGSPLALLPHLPYDFDSSLLARFGEALDWQERVCGCFTSSLSFVVKNLAEQPRGRDEYEEDIAAAEMASALGRCIAPNDETKMMTVSVTTRSEVQSLMNLEYSKVREFMEKFANTLIAVVETALLESYEKEFKSVCMDFNIVILEGLSEVEAERLSVFANVKSGLNPPLTMSDGGAGAKATASDFSRSLRVQTDLGIISSVRKDPSLGLGGKFDRHKKSVLKGLVGEVGRRVVRKKEEVLVEVVSYDGVSYVHEEKYPEQVGGEGGEWAGMLNNQCSFLKLTTRSESTNPNSNSFQTVVVKSRVRCQVDDLAREVRKSVMRVYNVETYGRLLPGKCVTEVVVSLALENRKGKGAELYRDYCVELMGYEGYVSLRDSVRAELKELGVKFDREFWWRDEGGMMPLLKAVGVGGGGGEGGEVVWDDWFGKRSAIGRAYGVFE
ncbi:hypothetical protein TrLO_g4427 [Triparma laevis f. longispina]|uniref:GAF domain-containing protein n=1 Tax=Triparma laevis f. longispina TaxID=1714387 RepID=A0A9W7FLW8_9STRA|nr:hypothetical protein TrLO_g4427 [Triparma laevis f. longispina]